MPELGVLLTPREIGGHEAALFGWLADAVREDGLQLALFAPTRALCDDARRVGLRPARVTWPPSAAAWRAAALRLLWRWPAERPLLLAPGVLHATAWLLAAALLLRRRVWVHVPTAFTAARMGYRGAALRDALLAPWLRRVERWILIDEPQVVALRQAWGISAPIHCLPNLARLPAPTAPAHENPAAVGLRVAYVGRFEPHSKGLDWLAETLRRRPPWVLRYHFRFQGRGPAEWLLRELASALGPQQMSLHPHAPVDEALRASDVLLLTSRYEGVPLVALEATLRGKPVVATIETGLARLLPPSSVFSFGDERGLRQALDSLRDPAARQRAVLHARRRQAQLWPPGRYPEARREIVQALRGEPR